MHDQAVLHSDPFHRIYLDELGAISEELRDRIATFPLTQLENLGEALLDFSAIADLATWLPTH